MKYFIILLIQFLYICRLHTAPNIPSIFINRYSQKKIILQNFELLKNQKAIYSGLNFLISQQKKDGSWGEANLNKNILTSLSLLSILGDGNDFTSPEYGKSFVQGLKYLLSTKSNNNLYSNIILAYTLAEIYGITDLIKTRDKSISIIKKISNHIDKQTDIGILIWYIQTLQIFEFTVNDLSRKSFSEYEQKLIFNEKKRINEILQLNNHFKLLSTYNNPVNILENNSDKTFFNNKLTQEDFFKLTFLFSSNKIKNIKFAKNIFNLLINKQNKEGFWNIDQYTRTLLYNNHISLSTKKHDTIIYITCFSILFLETPFRFDIKFEKDYHN